MCAAQDNLPPSAELLWDDAACGLLVTSANGLILKVNNTFCRWLGFQRTELVGNQHLQGLLSMSGRIFHQTHWAPLLQIEGSVAEVKLDVLHAEGHSIPMMLNAVRRQHGDSVFHEVAVFVAEDRHRYESEILRARKNAEALLANEQEAQAALTVAQARLRLALDLAQLYVWAVDASTRKRQYEDSVARLLGLPAGQRVEHGQFVARIHPDDREHEAEAFNLAVNMPGTMYQCTYRLQGFDGVERVISSSGQGFFGPDGRLLTFVGALQDVTDAARLRATAEDRALLAEQMIGIVSHDLRNPLAAIQASAHLLARGDLSADQYKVLSRITNSASRANRLIADLLDFTVARIGSGLAIAPQPVDLHLLVADNLTELRDAFPTRLLRHERRGEGMSLADADRLSQLIGNLVGNAVAYGDPAEPITVTSQIEARMFVLSVHNHGEPIPAASLRTLFEPMVRGDGSAADAKRSVGLGLFIVREIVRAHRGEILATSTAEDGTNFRAMFPRRVPTQPA